MKTSGMNRSVGLIVLLLVICWAVSAAPVSIDLGKTYEEKGVRISTIESLDLADLSESSAEILSTSEDGSDIKTLEMPGFGNVHRTFSATHAEFKDISLVINPSEMPDVNWAGMPPFNIYITQTVPTIRMTVPGWQGNAVVTGYPEDWEKDSFSDISTLLRTTEPVFMYHPDRIMRVDPAGNDYTGFGAFHASDYDKDNISYTLEHNLVPLDTGFLAQASLSEGYARAYPDNVLNVGRSGAGAFYLDSSSEKLTVLADYPVVILDQNSEMEWAWEGSGIEFEFTPAYTHQSDLRRTVVLLIKSDATYDVDVEVDVSELARRAKNRWNGMGSASPLLDILYSAIREDIEPAAFTYSLTASGEPAPPPPPATGWSQLAITDGYGCLGTSESASVTVPVSEIRDLLPGTYYAYLMGLNSQNEIIALDQKMMDMHRPTDPVADFSASPRSGTDSLTVEFTDESAGYPDTWEWDFGDGTSSTEQNPSHSYGVGRFTVTLNVSNSAGSDSITKTDYIQITRSSGRSDGGGSSGSFAWSTEEPSPTPTDLSVVEETATPHGVIRSEETKPAPSGPVGDEGINIWPFGVVGLLVVLLGAYLVMRSKQ